METFKVGRTKPLHFFRTEWVDSQAVNHRDKLDGD
jgi:hypothetical protein